MAQILDGKKFGEHVQAELKAQVAELKKEHNKVPGLAVVLVGERKDSATYVRMKQKAAEEAGIFFHLEKVPDTVDQATLISTVKTLNARDDIHGLLVQLPLPSGINEKAVLDEVKIDKDVDGFHPENIGKLAMRGRDPSFVSCTPKGCIQLLDHYKIPMEGKHAVILGRSNIVGMPAALLLIERNATVTICHSKTADLEDHVRRADIVIAAIGKPEMVRGNWLKPGAVVVDVGINPVDDKTKKAGYRLVGDVNFAEAQAVASWITPVPGGVGPVTVAMLLQSTVEAFKRSLKASSSSSSSSSK